MGKFEFAESSIRRLKQVDHNLSAVMYEAKERSIIDFDISCGFRPVEEQNILFHEGKSQLDGVRNKSKHNYKPARAVDIYAYNGKYADYDKDKMYYLSQVIKDAAEDLGVRITWGGDWKSFIDMPHYELS